MACLGHLNPRRVHYGMCAWLDRNRFVKPSQYLIGPGDASKRFELFGVVWVFY